MKNVDWSSFGIPSKTQRRILASLCEVIKCGYGEVIIKIHQHKIAEVNKLEKERMENGKGD